MRLKRSRRPLIASVGIGAGLSTAAMVTLAWLAMLAGAKASLGNCEDNAPPPTVAPSATLATLFRDAAAHYKLGTRGPSILAAIADVETGFGQNMGPSSAGAIGFMQFMPDTWATYGVDADGDGRRDPADPADAIFAAANYLHASGAPADWNKAIFAYNHSTSYVATVVSKAFGYAHNLPGTPIGPDPVCVLQQTTGAPGQIILGAKPGLPVADFIGIVQGTHQTDGLPGFPAKDYGAPAGSPVISPVDGTVYKLSGHDPADGPSGPGKVYGWSVYIKGTDGREYFLTHLGTRTTYVGQQLKQGEQIGTVADFAKYGTVNHIHMGVHQ